MTRSGHAAVHMLRSRFYIRAVRPGGPPTIAHLTCADSAAGHLVLTL